MNKKKDKDKVNIIHFTINETKKFNFTQEQYINLEREYNRYSIYNKLIKNIEKILSINDVFEYNKRKKYENKNIIERFILECINHGISPHINHDISQHINHGISPHINHNNHHNNNDYNIRIMMIINVFYIIIYFSIPY